MKSKSIMRQNSKEIQTVLMGKDKMPLSPHISCCVLKRDNSSSLAMGQDSATFPYMIEKKDSNFF